MLARSASSVKSSTARSSMAGVRYSTGIDDSGGRWNSARICEPDRVEYPVSSRGDSRDPHQSAFDPRGPFRGI
jgi:hypothetical protein